ncbi:MAG: sulfotransferase [Cyanobacteriota bacterium]|nr:sulfotransferase [Cyanobacteriota bacterium]
MNTPFFIAGAPKSGTSSLAYLLGIHPEIFIPHQKELFFFDFNYHLGINWYEQLFDQSGNKQILGDATPWYMSWGGVPERIAEHFPDARIIFLLREPAARAWSHFWHDYSSLKIQLDLSPIEYFQQSPDPRRIRACSLYATHLRRWLEVFPPRQILLASTRSLQDQPLLLLNAIAQFLGCTQAFELEGVPLGARRMPGLSPRSIPVKGLTYFQRNLGGSQFSVLADAINSHPRLKRLFFSLRSMPLSEDVKSWLCPIFESDYQQFVDLVGTDVVASTTPLLLG